MRSLDCAGQSGLARAFKPGSRTYLNLILSALGLLESLARRVRPAVRSTAFAAVPLRAIAAARKTGSGRGSFLMGVLSWWAGAIAPSFGRPPRAREPSATQGMGRERSRKRS